MSHLSATFRAAKRRALCEGPGYGLAYTAIGAVLVWADYPWIALLLAFLGGSLIGSSIISCAWLRSHYRKEWDA